MFTNYLKIALRNLLKKKFYTFINIVGLGIGMACCLLISLYVLDELSYDRFHEKADRIYRVTVDARIGESLLSAGHVNEHMGEVLNEIPEIEAVTRVKENTNWTIRLQDEVFLENDIIAVDTSFFHIFTFPLLEGNAETFLQEPASVILTEKMADKYFGTVQGVVGRTLEINHKPYTVTGIIQNPPQQAHFHFNIIVPLQYQIPAKVNWLDLGNNFTYVLLQENVSYEPVLDKIDALFQKYNPEAYEEIKKLGFARFLLQPITDIHLFSHFLYDAADLGNLKAIYIFAAIAVFILLIAGVNFVNLATARSADRAKEVGIRKTLGSVRTALIRQFLTESVLMSLLAMLIALGMAELFRNPFNEISGKSMDIFINHQVWLVALGISLLVGLIAGLYPALYLTRFKPVEVLRGSFAKSSRGRTFRNALVVFQFVISIGLIICTVLVYQQLQYMRQKELGIHKENVILLKNADKLGTQYESLMHTLANDSRIMSVTASDQEPFSIYNGSSMMQKGKEDADRKITSYTRVSYDYLKTMGIMLKEGRDFSRMMASDTAAIIINEAAAKAFGLEDPLNSLIEVGENTTYHVIGVTENFHFQSLDKKIAPLVMLLYGEVDELGIIEVRMQGQDMVSMVADLENNWKQFAPDVPFDYTFLDETFDALFKNYQQLSKIVTLFAGLAILIACLGLLALAAFMAEQRTKEIGIRKVMGASVKDIVLMLSGNFTKLIVLAFIIAIPLAYLAMQQWLQDFAYRIDISIWTFMIAGALAILIAWLTISYQAVKAARSNPVEALRYE